MKPSRDSGSLTPRPGLVSVNRTPDRAAPGSRLESLDASGFTFARVEDNDGVDEVVIQGAEAVKRRKVAVLVCHGMGQQVPFETLDSVASLLAPDHVAAGTSTKPQVRFARLGERRMPRAELTLAEGDMLHDVHVYEGYWAPLMEGQVTARDVTRFLFGAGWSGIRYASRHRFDRYMFGAMRPLRIGAALPRLAAAFAVVCSALLLYAAFAFVIAARAWDLLFLPADRSWPGESLTDQLSYDLLRSPLGLGAAAVLGATVWGFLKLFFREKPARPAEPRDGTWRTRREEAPRLGARWILLLVAGLAWMMASLYWIVDDTVRWYRADGQAEENIPGIAEAIVHTPLFVVFAVCAGIALLRLRSFYIQYLGDVAVYVSSHTVNRFNDVRDRVRCVGRDAARALYAEKAGGKFLYDRVLVVGHSLGSVVAYDTLNSVLNEDVESGLGLDVEGRTLGLVTFGSPLDKTAFVFRTQLDRADAREALAAANQPLIEPPCDAQGNARGRKIEWINIWSPLDPISGALRYYDPPEGTPMPPEHTPVRNVVDGKCSVYGAAHNQYWRNPLLAGVLFERITARSMEEAALEELAGR